MAATQLLSKICSPPRFSSILFTPKTSHFNPQRTTPKWVTVRIRPLNSTSTPGSAESLADTDYANLVTMADAEITKTNSSNSNNNPLACPVCYRPLIWNGEPLSVGTTAGVNLQCGACKKDYVGNETHLELTVVTGTRESMPVATEIFRTSLVSYLYERGWRQAFVWGGFPGPEKEFEMAKEYLRPVIGGNIVDASCGSGMFSRLFAKSGLFSRVIALDFSENMLKQCYEFIQQEDNFPKEKLTLVRADIARLPLISGSIDAVHAGAALHCWPSPSVAVAEISRVLRPGGVFVATTFITDGPFSGFSIVKGIREQIGQAAGTHIFLSEGELEDLCKACGLVRFTSVRNGLFVMVSAAKPC